MCPPGLKIKEPNYHNKFFQSHQNNLLILCTAGQKKNTNLFWLSSLSKHHQFTHQQNCCSASELQLLEEGHTLGCCLSCKIRGWRAHFLMKHVCFYTGAPPVLFIKAYLSDGLRVGWSNKQSWLRPQGGRTPHRIHFPLFTALKIFLTMHHLYFCFRYTTQGSDTHVSERLQGWRKTASFSLITTITR